MPTTTKPAPQATTTAQQFAKPVMTMARAEFDKLIPADKSAFFKNGGKLI
jgi:hypothetical protein